MNLQEAIAALQQAVREVSEAALSDDKTPLGNELALRQTASLVGVGEDGFDVVVFGDINHFKRFNYDFGYVAGDAAIGYVGGLINTLTEECHALGFRLGGDEFIILLQSRYLERFKRRAASFASCRVPFEGKAYETSMSFGYAINPGEASFTDLRAKAETACKIAKTQGAGLCIEWSEEKERASFKHFRERCTDCGTEIECYVPQQSAHPNSQLKRCPFCEEPLLKGQTFEDIDQKAE